MTPSSSLAARTLACIACLDGCSAPADPEPLLSCADASAAVRSGLRPEPFDRAGAIVAGESLPVYRLSESAMSAEDLAARAVVLVCALRDGEEARPTAELWEWAEKTLADEIVWGAVFEDGNLVVGYALQWHSLGILDSSAFPLVPEVFDDADGPDPGVGSEFAADLSFEIQARLEASCMLTPRSLSVDDALQSLGGGSLGSYVDQYTTSLPAMEADIRVLGPLLQVSVTRDGEVSGIWLSDLDIAQVGTETAALSQADATDELVALAEAAHDPEVEITLDTAFPVYRLGAGQASSEQEPKLLGVYYAGYPDSQVAPRPTSVLMSLVWPEQGLAPFE